MQQRTADWQGKNVHSDVYCIEIEIYILWFLCIPNVK